MSSMDQLLNEEHEEFKQFMKDEGVDIENRQDDVFAKGSYHIAFKAWLRARSLMWLYPYYKSSEHAKLVKINQPTQTVDF